MAAFSRATTALTVPHFPRPWAACMRSGSGPLLCSTADKVSTSSSDAQRLSPSSVVRLTKQPFELVELVASGELPGDATSQAVLDHVDGVSDITMVADLAGVPRPEALHRMHALLDLGLLEVVNGRA